MELDVTSPEQRRAVIETAKVVAMLFDNQGRDGTHLTQNACAEAALLLRGLVEIIEELVANR